MSFKSQLGRLNLMQTQGSQGCQKIGKNQYRKSKNVHFQVDHPPKIEKTSKFIQNSETFMFLKSDWIVDLELYTFEFPTFVLIFWHILEFKVQWFETDLSNPSFSDLVLSRIGSFKSTNSYFRTISFVT